MLQRYKKDGIITWMVRVFLKERMSTKAYLVNPDMKISMPYMKNRRGQAIKAYPLHNYQFSNSQLHHTRLWRHCRSLLFRLVHYQALGCQEHTCDGSSVLKSHTGNLCRIDDT